MNYLILITSIFGLLSNSVWPCYGSERLHTSITAMKGKELLGGKSFRLPAYHFPPFLSMEPEETKGQSVTMLIGNTSYSGFIIDIMHWFEEYYDLSLEFIPLNESEVHRVGEQKAVIEQLMREEIDLAAYPIPLAWDDDCPSMLQFTFPIETDEFYLMQKWPTEKTRLTAMISPFSHPVWISFLLSTAVTVVLMSIISSIHHQWQNTEISSFGIHVYHHFEYALSILTNQGNYVPYNSLQSYFVLVGIWCLMMTVLVNSYTGSVTSHLIQPQLNPLVDTLEELAERRMKVTVLRGSPMAESFLDADSGLYHILGDSIRKNPKLLVKDFEHVTENVLGMKDCAFVGNEKLIRIALAENVDRYGKCSLTVSKPLQYSESRSFGIGERGLVNRLIDTNLIYLWESGLMDFWLKQYIPSIDHCLVRETGLRYEAPRKLKPIYLSSAFLLFGLGVGIAIIIFLMELTATSFAKRHSMKKMQLSVKNSSTDDVETIIKEHLPTSLQITSPSPADDPDIDI